MDFFKKVILFHTGFLRCFQNIKKMKKKSQFKKLPKQYTKSVFLSFFFLLYNKTILKIKKNITKTLNFHRNLVQKKITIITPNNNKNNTVNNININIYIINSNSNSNSNSNNINIYIINSNSNSSNSNSIVFIIKYLYY